MQNDVKVRLKLKIFLLICIFIWKQVEGKDTDSGSEIESVSDAAKIANMVMTGAGEGWNLFRERQCQVKYEIKIFGRQAGHYGFGGREGERGVDYLLRKTDKEEISFRGIESKIIRRHPRWDESDNGLKVVYGIQDIFINKWYKEFGVISM